MKRVSSLTFSAALVLCLAIVLARVMHGQAMERLSAAEVSTPEPVMETAAPEASADAQISVTVLEGDAVAEYTMADYLPGVLAGEMPASFETEALKAQAVAARTYILYCQRGVSQKHPEADVCNDAACCKAYGDVQQLQALWGDGYETNMAKIRQAVAETDGLYLTYENEPIQAVFHSSSAGRTEAGGNLWSPLPYLVSVDSPETEADVPNFISTVEIESQELARTVLTAHPEAQLTGSPESWLGAVSVYDSGRVAGVELGGAVLSGAEMRSLFALRSTSFALEYTGDSFLFTVRGYGHGVGLSQYGANVMAKAGADFREILAHYYPGTELTG